MKILYDQKEIDSIIERGFRLWVEDNNPAFLGELNDWLESYGEGQYDFLIRKLKDKIALYILTNF